MNSSYTFSLHQKVSLAMSGEKGTVVGRFEATDHPPQYRVRYVAADGRQVADWFWASEIQSEAPPLSHAA